jgi:trehalose 6-phosphate phosphatase
MTIPKLGANHAVFLDMDGTLIDLAATPDAVIVPPDLQSILRRAATRAGGALAILSGRKLADIDRLLGAHLACAAEHGAILRSPEGIVTQNVQRPAAYSHWLKILSRYAALMPGILIEEKQFSLVVHYRQAPEHEAELGQLVERLIGESSDAQLLLAHCAFEMKPRGGDKGDALAWFMQNPPFAGKIPVFVGDDVTDEPAIRAANALAGAGLHVARDFAGSTHAVRAWLAGDGD